MGPGFSCRPPVPRRAGSGSPGRAVLTLAPASLCSGPGSLHKSPAEAGGSAEAEITSDVGFLRKVNEKIECRVWLVSGLQAARVQLVRACLRDL